ncbi:unnamed protein product [Brachionus calyciflorus]|uniref:Ankyrin n=1 Tax=Brachionus calyciflorus TaxID=104777 RepID=A0A813LZU0_9BILA|nr:unnamed protein product [Brachionus calyciflorus]
MDQSDLFQNIKNGNIEKCREILSSQPNLINKYFYGVTPLMYSIECEQEEIAFELCQTSGVDLSLKDNLDSTLLEKSIEYKMFKIIEYLCQNFKKSVVNDYYLENGETYLTSAIKSGENQTVKAFVNGKIDVNKPNKSNQYPIQLAIKFNKISILKELLKADNVYIGTFDNGYNPLLDACENDMTDIALVLIENGADINICDQDQNWTPLMHAICNNNEILVSKLLENGCDLAMVDFNRNTPVHLAVLTENEYILRLLLKYNVNKNLENSENLTPLQIAQLNDDENSIRLLS